MLRLLTNAQLSELIAYDSIDPIGSEREDLRFGILSALTANIHRDRRLHPQPYAPAEFMPFSRKQRPQTTAEQREIIELINAAHAEQVAERSP